MSKRIFLSHSSQDQNAVRQLAEDLKRAGLDPWLDEWEIQVGDHITQRIQEGLMDTAYLAVWLTRAAVESSWVEREWQTQYGAAINTGEMTVLPLLAEDCDVPLFLRGPMYADFRHDYREGLNSLLRVFGVQSWENELGMKFSFIPPGAFLMGSEQCEENERPVHQVTIGRPFYMGTHVVTQRQWKEIMGTNPWQGDVHVREGNDYPAVNVSWYDAQDFLTRLSNIDKNSAYYLPTEEEWEYAARAGTSTKFSFGNDERDMQLYGWYRDLTQNGEEYAHKVGQKKPNLWNLYDMHGNIWEWMDDWYYGSYAAPPNLKPLEKVLRGGGWDYPAYGARSAFRNHLLPTRSNHVIGIRLIRRGYEQDRRRSIEPLETAISKQKEGTFMHTPGSGDEERKRRWWRFW